MPVLTEAYQKVFKQGFDLMSQLSEVLEREDEAIVTQLREAASCFMQAIELQSDQAPPYLMLASIYLGMGETALVHKYMELAEKITPGEPALLYLKDYLASPAYFQSLGQKRKSKAPVLHAQAIPKVQAVLSNQDKPSTGSLAAAAGTFARFFVDILPLVHSAQDLQDWVNDCYGHVLSEQDTLFLFEMMLGEAQGDAKTLMLQVQAILGAIRPEFAKQVSSFGREMARSIYGVVRQVHLLLRPLAPQYPNPEAVAAAISARFAEPLSQSEAQAIFDLLTAPPYREPLVSLQHLKQVLDRIYPPPKDSLDLSPFVEALLVKA